MSAIYDILKKNTDLSEEKLHKFETYARILCDWNEKINLTAITDPTNIAIKHFLDCIKIYDIIDLEDNAKCIDIGTGAGFPGVVLKLCNDTLDFTLLDSLNKRIRFLEDLCLSLDIDAHIIHSRAEDGARDNNLREMYDYAFSRGVAKLNVLLEYCLPYVKVNGIFIAMKGLSAPQECELSKEALKKLGAKIEDIKQFKLINGDTRSLVTIRKVKSTPEEFPRNPAKILNKPL